MQIHDHEEALVFLLQFNEIFDRPDIITECERTAGLNARQYFFGHDITLHIMYSVLAVRKKASHPQGT
jgi:hypothetical protein